MSSVEVESRMEHDDGVGMKPSVENTKPDDTELEDTVGIAIQSAIFGLADYSNTQGTRTYLQEFSDDTSRLKIFLRCKNLPTDRPISSSTL